MKKRFIVVFFLLLPLCVVGQKSKKGNNRQTNVEIIDGDRPSVLKKAEGLIGKDKVTIQWGSPSVKGREIFGSIVPYDEVWRAGANEATNIEFEGDVLIGGKELKAGKYGLFMIPTQGEWTIIFNSVWNQWGAFEYDDQKDVLRIKVKPEHSTKSETLEYKIETTGIALYWDTLRVKFTVSKK